MTEAEIYKELGALTKKKEKWKESISYVSSLLNHDSAKIQASGPIWSSCDRYQKPTETVS